MVFNTFSTNKLLRTVLFVQHHTSVRLNNRSNEIRRTCFRMPYGIINSVCITHSLGSGGDPSICRQRYDADPARFM